MKNLKKVLSLALAFAMVLGLCITASAVKDPTTLSDWENVPARNKAAIQFLSAVEIIQGHDDGTFKPAENVTRAEAAKMISVALWGGNDDDAGLYAGGNLGNYTDVDAGAWYMGYVNYMTLQGIMEGDGNGKFRPNDPVSGYELLKMALTALGYKSEIEGLTGAGWDLRTMALAKKVDITGDQKVNPTTGTLYTPRLRDLTTSTSAANWGEPLNRADAAQIIFNMTQRSTVTYDDMSSNNSGNVVVYQDRFLTRYLGLVEYTATVVGNEFGVLKGDEFEATETNRVVNTANKLINTSSRYYNNEDTVLGYTTLVTRNDAGVITRIDSTYYKGNLDTTFEDIATKYTVYAKSGVVVLTIANDYQEVAPEFVKQVMSNGEFEDNIPLVDYYLNNELVSAADVYAYGVFNAAGTEFTPDHNVEIHYVDTDMNGYIDTVKAYVFTGPAAVTKVADDGAISVTTSEDALKAAETTIEPTAGDRIAYKSLDTSVGAGAYGNYNYGYIMKAEDHTVTRTWFNDTLDVDLDDVYTVNGINPDLDGGTPEMINYNTTGTFYFWADGAISTYSVPDPAAAKYAVLYDAKLSYHEDTVYGDKTNVVTLEVTAILESGESAKYNVTKIVAFDETADKNVTYTIAKQEKGTNDVETMKSDEELKKPGDSFDAKTLFGKDDGLFYNLSNAEAEDDAINYLVKYTLDGKNMTITEIIGAVATTANDTRSTAPITPAVLTEGPKHEGNVVNIRVSTDGSTSQQKYVTSTTVTFIQIAPDTKGEQWKVYVGQTTPQFTVTSGTTKSVVDLVKFGTLEDRAVGAVALQDISLNKVNLRYAIKTNFWNENANGDRVYSTLTYNLTTNTFETLRYIAEPDDDGKYDTGAMDKKFYDTYSYEDGLDLDTDALENWNWGFITYVGDNAFQFQPVVGDPTIFAVDGNTEFDWINGNDSKGFTFTELSSLIGGKQSIAGGNSTDSYGYKAIVIGTGLTEEDSAGNPSDELAVHVIVLKDAHLIEATTVADSETLAAAAEPVSATATYGKTTVKNTEAYSEGFTLEGAEGEKIDSFSVTFDSVTITSVEGMTFKFNDGNEYKVVSGKLYKDGKVTTNGAKATVTTDGLTITFSKCDFTTVKFGATNKITIGNIVDAGGNTVGEDGTVVLNVTVKA